MYLYRPDDGPLSALYADMPTSIRYRPVMLIMLAGAASEAEAPYNPTALVMRITGFNSQIQESQKTYMRVKPGRSAFRQG